MTYSVFQSICCWQSYPMNKVGGSVMWTIGFKYHCQNLCTYVQYYCVYNVSLYSKSSIVQMYDSNKPESKGYICSKWPFDKMTDRT